MIYIAPVLGAGTVFLLLAGERISAWIADRIPPHKEGQ